MGYQACIRYIGTKQCYLEEESSEVIMFCSSCDRFPAGWIFIQVSIWDYGFNSWKGCRLGRTSVGLHNQCMSVVGWLSVGQSSTSLKCRKINIRCVSATCLTSWVTGFFFWKVRWLGGDSSFLRWEPLEKVKMQRNIYIHIYVCVFGLY